MFFVCNIKNIIMHINKLLKGGKLVNSTTEFTQDYNLRTRSMAIQNLIEFQENITTWREKR